MCFPIRAAVLIGALLAASPALAHFGILAPDRSMAMAQKEAEIEFDVAFAHPFAQSGMKMEKPEGFFVVCDGERANLLDALKPVEYLGQPAFTARYQIKKPGVYLFAVAPRPYYEPAEDSFIIHYAKTVIGAFGYDEGWDAPLGLPVEIIPLSRPFGNYAGNVFTGLVLKDGKPLAGAEVEVEFLNSAKTRAAPNSYFETQLVKTDANGVFSFGIPWPGWWGFAALAQGAEKIKHGGEPKNVELGGIIWVEFAQPQINK